MMSESYSPKQVAAIVGVTESRVRYWAQTGFVGPSDRKAGRMAYSFLDLISVKAAKELLDGGLTLQRARQNLDALRVLLPHVDRPLAELRIICDGEQVLVRDRETAFEPTTGQTVMDFRIDALTPGGAVHTLPAAREIEHETEHAAYVALLEGIALEGAGDDDGAQAAYERAIAADARLSAAHTNLGNLAMKRGDHARAELAYDAALASDPGQPEARFNLGNLYRARGQEDDAVTAWYRVIADCPEFAAAHFNLAASFSENGAYGPARAHLYRFLALESSGPWADAANQALAALTPPT